MVGKTNAGGGKLFATISVTYPSGSTCTCSDGGKTLKLKDTSGLGIFLIPYAATWTVMCYDGADYESSEHKKFEAVEITTKGQGESVTLRYALVLFDNGSQVPWTAYNEDSKPNGVVIGAESIEFRAIKSYKSAATTNSYDMTPYNTAHLIGNVKQVYETDDNNIPRFMVTNKVYELGNHGLANKTFSRTGPVSLDLDISSITGSHKIEIWGTFYGTITKVWLTED